jgi:hypothetical protein
LEEEKRRTNLNFIETIVSKNNLIVHQGWRELYTLQTRPEAVKVCSLCYCCREVVPTSDGAGKKRILIYVFI